MGKKLSELTEAISVAISDIFHLRTPGGIDKKILPINFFKTAFSLILTTKGDLAVRGDTFTERIAAGAANTVLKGKGAEILPAYEQIALEDITAHSRVRVTKNNAQTIGIGATAIVQYDDEIFDNLNEYNTGTYRFTAQKAGYYFVSASLQAVPKTWTTNRYWQLYLYKNGTKTITGMMDTSYSSSDGGKKTSQIATIIYMEVADYIDIRIFSGHVATVNSTTDATVNYFAVHRLS